ncbi:MAG: hypothetical protein H0W06_00635 [Chloroflexia bacterium]|nr:hypothetical protein [Chloroflexia bacterium]
MASTITTLKTGIMALALSLGLAAAGSMAVAQEATPPSTPDPGSSPAPVT